MLGKRGQGFNGCVLKGIEGTFFIFEYAQECAESGDIEDLLNGFIKTADSQFPTIALQSLGGGE